MQWYEQEVIMVFEKPSVDRSDDALPADDTYYETVKNEQYFPIKSTFLTILMLEQFFITIT